MTQAAIINYPPEVSGLIVRWRGVRAAEAAAGVRHGTFAMIRNQQIEYGFDLKLRVCEALEDHDRQQPTKRNIVMANPNVQIPEGCPPLLADFIRHQGTLHQTYKALGTGDGTLRKVVNGKAKMPDVWASRIRAAMTKSASPATTQAAESAIPPFTPWDGKTVGQIEVLKNGKKARVVKKVPMPIVELFAKMGSMADAGRSIGYSTGWLQNFIDSHRVMNLKLQKKIHAALHDQPPTGLQDDSEQFDEYRMDMAIVVTKAQNYDRIAEIAEILNGRLLFKMQTGVGWILIYRIKGDDARKFKKLAMRDAQKLVCP